MEFEEQEGFVNPQNGEKIAPKKPKRFWLEWRFWVYSVIALMLVIISISSMCTACAAINAGVGQDADTSEDVRQRKDAYYDVGSVSVYGSVAGTASNYSESLYWVDGGSSRSFNAGSVISVAQNGAFRWQSSYIGESYVDIYENGALWKTVSVAYSGITDAISFDVSKYYWFFNHDNFNDGYLAGLDVNGQFHSVSPVRNPVNFSSLRYESEWYASTNEKHWRLFSYDRDGSNYYCAIDAFFDSVVPDSWKVYLCVGLTNHPSYVSAAAHGIGEWTLYEISDLYVGDQGFALLNGSTQYFDGVIRSVYYSNYSQYVDLQVDNVDLYQEGYDAGKSYGEWDGRIKGAASALENVQPDALTDTMVAVFQQPFNQIYRFFNFNILGLNILGLVAGLLSIFVIIKVLKKVL